jgi:translation initiation factor IF-2
MPKKHQKKPLTVNVTVRQQTPEEQERFETALEELIKELVHIELEKDRVKKNQDNPGKAE